MQMDLFPTFGSDVCIKASSSVRYIKETLVILHARDVVM